MTFGYRHLHVHDVPCQPKLQQEQFAAAPFIQAGSFMAVLKPDHLNNLAFDIEHRLRDVHGPFPTLTLGLLLTHRPDSLENSKCDR